MSEADSKPPIAGPSDELSDTEWIREFLLNSHHYSNLERTAILVGKFQRIHYSAQYEMRKRLTSLCQKLNQPHLAKVTEAIPIKPKRNGALDA